MQCDICDCGKDDVMEICYLVSDDVREGSVWAYSVDNMFIFPICSVCLISLVEYHPDVCYRHYGIN